MGKASKKEKGSKDRVLVNQGRREKVFKPSQESASKGSLQKTSVRATFIPILILLLVAFAVYFNALFGDFIYDDKTQILDNLWIRDIRNIPTIFLRDVWSFQTDPNTSNYYRPMMHVVYMLNYHVFGLKPWGFHLINILFHCGTSVLVFLIIRKFLTDQRVSKSSVYLSPAFIAALLFASHPIHTEAVTWIAGLPDVAVTFFYLLSFYLYTLFRDDGKRSYLLSILSFSVATLFKEPALTLPVMLIAYDYLFKKWDKTILSEIKVYIPYVVVSGVYLVMRYYALRSLAPMESYTHLSTYQVIINIFPLFRDYLTSLLWPFDLNFWHTFHPISSLMEMEGVISLAVTIIFIVAMIVAYRKHKEILFGLLLVVIPLLPVFYIKGISGRPYAERYLYLPSLGYVFLVVIFLSWAREKLPHTVKSITIVIMVVIGIYATETIKRNAVWKDSFSFWSDTVKKSPDSARAHSGLGIAYASQGQWDRAIEEFQIALGLKPDFMDAHYNLGIAYASKGQLNRAIEEYQTVLRLKPDVAEVHNNLGAAYLSQGLLDRAKTELQTASRLKPDFTEAHYNLAAIYLSEGNVELARKEVELVLRISPDQYEARKLLNVINSRQH